MVSAYNIILNVIPFLIIDIIGMVISIKKRRYQKQPASLAIIAYGTLIILLLINLAQNIWISWAESQDMLYSPRSMSSIRSLSTIIAVVHYIVLAALMVGVFIGRKDTGGSYKKPVIIVVTVILWQLITSPIFASVTFPYIFYLPFVFLICTISTKIALLVALYGWRNDAGLKPLAENQSQASVVAIASDTATNDYANSVPSNKGVFEEKDYIPFAAGILVLGGIVIVPIVWAQIVDIYYPQALFPSLLSCAIFIYAHDKRGNFSLGKFLLGFLVVLFQIMRTTAEHGVSEQPMFLAGGIVGFLIMYACGWAGIMIARFFRRKILHL